MDRTCHAPSGRSMSTAALLAARADVVRFVLVSVASGGHTACLETLIRAKADVNERVNKRTPTVAASAGGHIDCLKALIAARGSMTAKSLVNDGDFRTPAMAAAVGGQVDCLNALIAAGACEYGWGDDAQALAVGATEVGNIECLNALLITIIAGSDVNATGKLGQTLAVAAAKGNLDCLNALISARADLNAGGRYGPLAVAAAKGNLNCLNALISGRADLHTEGRYGLTPVAAAAKSGKIECLNILIAAGADVNPRAGDMHETKPIIKAIRAGNIKCLDALLAASADATGRCKFQGKTALMEACTYGRPDMLRLLIESKTDINAEDQWGQTALVLVRRDEERFRPYAGEKWKVDKFRKCVSILEPAATAAAAAVQLLTLHLADPNADGSVSVLATSLGGDEVAQVQVDLSDTMELVDSELQVELSPRERRFMSADARLLDRGGKKTTLRDWLVSPAD